MAVIPFVVLQILGGGGEFLCGGRRMDSVKQDELQESAHSSNIRLR